MCRNMALCGNGLTLYCRMLTFYDCEKMCFWQHCGKKRKCWKTVIGYMVLDKNISKLFTI